MPEALNFSLRELFNQPTTKRARRAILRLRRFLAKRFKVKEDAVYISQKINEAIFARGPTKIPRVLQLQIVKEENKVSAYMHDEEIPPKEKEKKAKEEKPAKKEAEKPEQKKAAEKPEKVAEAKEELPAEEAEEKKKLEEKREMEKAAEKASIKRKLDK